MTGITLRAYPEAIKIARALLDPGNLSTAELESDENRAYARALVELLTDLWPLPGDAGERKQQVELDLGLRELPEVLVRVPARDWDALVEARRTMEGSLSTLEAAAAKVAQGEVLADGPAEYTLSADPPEPGALSRGAIEAMHVEGVLARLETLKPALGPKDRHLAHDLLAEYIAISRKLDEWWRHNKLVTRDTDTARHVREARAWLLANGLPTQYRPDDPSS